MKTAIANLFLSCFDNSIDAFIPEQWAMESVAILSERLGAAGLVHRDFEELFFKFGNTVHTRQPAELQAYRKTNADDVTVQDVSATDIEVKLNQHIHTSILIRDGEESQSMLSLIDFYIRPAALALSRKMDKIVLGQYVQFIQYHGGSLGGLTNSNAVDYITETREVMNVNLAFEDNRRLILTPTTETKIIQNATFHQADRLGDDGTALREASLGRKFGFDTYMMQNMRSITGSNPGLGAINNASGYPIGTTVVTVNGFGASEVVAGQWVSIAGRPYHVTATDNATATQLTLEYGLTKAVVDTAAIAVGDKGAVNFGAGYAVNYGKTITVSGFSAGDIKVGMLVTFGTSNVRYAVIETNGSTTLELDRPLEVALTDTQTVNLGPVGDYNFAFHRSAVTLAIRPLKLPRLGAGAIGAIASFNNLTVRVVITYNGDKQGHLVTWDFLAGIKVLDTKLGAVMLA